MNATNFTAISFDAAKKLIGNNRLQQLIQSGRVKYARRGASDSGSFILLDSLPFRERLKIADFLASTQGQSSIQHPHSNMRIRNSQAGFVKVQHSPLEALKMRLETLYDLLREVELFYQSGHSHLSAHSSLPAESNSIGNLTQFLEAQEHAISYFLSKHTSFEHPEVCKMRDKL